MTSQRKNVLVGLTVLGSFAVLGWMIIQFGGRIGGLASGTHYTVQMQVPRVDGLAEGNQVRYLGQTVGRVDQINLAEGRTSFILDLALRPEANLPANVVGVIRATNLISGGAAIDLQLVSDNAQGSLREVADERVLEGTFAGADLVPPEFAQLAQQMEGFVAELRASGLVGNVNQQVERIGQVVESLNQVVGDEQAREDLKQIIANARQTTESAARTSREIEAVASRLDELETEASGVLSDARVTIRQTGDAVASARENIDTTGQNLNEASQRLVAQLEETNRILANLNQITTKVNNGEGTAGKLINDDRAYEALVDSLRILQDTLRSTNRLLEQWEQEGIDLNLF